MEQREKAKKKIRKGVWMTLLFGGLLVGARIAFGSAGGFLILGIFLYSEGIHPLISGILDLREARLPDGGAARREQMARFDPWANRRASLAVPLLMFGGLVLVGIFQVVLGFGRSVEVGGLLKDAVREGEWWRLATGTVLHGGIVHLLFNSLFLLYVGHRISGYASSAHIPVVFVVSALAGSLASLLLMPGTDSVGASGGLMGLLGYLLAYGLVFRDRLPALFLRPVFEVILAIAAIGLALYDVIDNAAHAGGLVAGFLVGRGLLVAGGRRAPPVAGPVTKLLAGAALAAFFLCCGLVARDLNLVRKDEARIADADLRRGVRRSLARLERGSEGDRITGARRLARELKEVDAPGVLVRAARSLTRAFESGDAPLRAAAAAALAPIAAKEGPPEAVRLAREGLRKALADPHVGVVREAEDAMDRYGLSR